LTPTISYNTLNSSLDPTKGKSMTIGLSTSGGPLGGKVNTIEPTFEFKSFRPFFAGKEASLSGDPKKTRTLGFRVLFAHIGVFGTIFESNSLSFIDGMPLFSRFYLGGENDIRGYNIRSIAPLVPLINTFTNRNVFVTDLAGNTLKVRRPRASTANSVAPGVISQFTVTDEAVPTVPGVPVQQVPLGGDTEALFNIEYRIPILGPVAVVPFFDVGSAFNLAHLNDQFVTSNFVLNPNPIATVTLNPRGEMATQREINQARTPETPPGALPAGFRVAFVHAEQSTKQTVALSQAASGIFQNYRYSTGAEIRVQVPVINVPFRLIFAWNPNARLDNPFVLEQRRAIRFSIGRTF